MKAVTTTQYGGVDVLRLQEIKNPVIEKDEILIKIHAASVNPIDWRVRKGSYKFLTGRRPPTILGNDFAGIVVDIGNDISTYKIGEAVWGFVEAFDRGTYAEYVKVREQEISRMPNNLNFEEAASIPTVGLTAYQALMKLGNLQPDNFVLINGCSGGVGTAAIQIAKAAGAKVFGVASTKNLDYAKKLGTDFPIDYTKSDVLSFTNCYDIFFDVASNKTFFQARDTLKKNGIYILALPSIQSMIFSPLINLLSSKKFKTFDCKSNTDDLLALKELVENNMLLPVIENTYSLEQIRDAHTKSESGHVVGKLVIKITN